MRGGNGLLSGDKEQEMRSKIRIIGVSLAAMAGLLLASGVAWANPNKTPISGQVVALRVIEFGDIWTDEDGVRHIRNNFERLQYVGDIDGRQFKVFSGNWDPASGEGDFHGSLTFFGFVGEDEVRARGRFAAVCSGLPMFCEFDEIWHLKDGRVIKFTSVTSFPGEIPWDYVGTLLAQPRHR